MTLPCGGNRMEQCDYAALNISLPTRVSTPAVRHPGPRFVRVQESPHALRALDIPPNRVDRTPHLTLRLSPMSSVGVVLWAAGRASRFASARRRQSACCCGLALSCWMVWAAGRASPFVSARRRKSACCCALDSPIFSVRTWLRSNGVVRRGSAWVVTAAACPHGARPPHLPPPRTGPVDAGTDPQVGPSAQTRPAFPPAALPLRLCRPRPVSPHRSEPGSRNRRVPRTDRVAPWLCDPPSTTSRMPAGLPWLPVTNQ